jgi:hypothetical protein
MPKLSEVNIAAEIAKGRTIVTDLKRIKVEHGADWHEADGRMLYHVASFITGQIERALDAFARLSVLDLAWATRNLFELTIISDYLSRSQQNRERFMKECALDSLFVMDKLKAIDERGGAGSRNEVVEAKRQRLKQKVGVLKNNQQGSRTTHDIADEIGRLPDFTEMYRVLSKMSHPTPWAMLGGTDETLSWDYFALYLVIRATGYAAECCQHLSKSPSTVVKT